MMCKIAQHAMAYVLDRRMTDRQTDRQAGRQAGRQAVRQTERQTERQRDRETERKTLMSINRNRCDAKRLHLFQRGDTT